MPNPSKISNAKERTSVKSNLSLSIATTVSSDCKDPMEFLKKRGYNMLGPVGEGSFAKYVFIFKY